jgi:transposase
MPKRPQGQPLARKRRWWSRIKARIEASRRVFIDETWIKASMAPLRGRCKRGQRLKTHAPHGHWKTLTFLAAVRVGQVTAPCVFDGPINGECFLAYVEQVPVPSLRPRDIVVIDSLGSHKAQAAKDAIEKAGAKLIFLPPYSPDLNPIEQTFSKIKSVLQKAMGRTVQAAEAAIADVIPTISPTECRNDFRNAGYASAEMDQSQVFRNVFELRADITPPNRSTPPQRPGRAALMTFHMYWPRKVA